MRALQGIVVAVVAVVAACKGKSPPPAATGSAAAVVAGSATAPAPAPAAGSAEAPAPAAPAAAKAYEGPTFTVTSSLSGPDIKTKDIDTEAGKTTMTMYAFTNPSDDNVMQMVESNAIAVVPKGSTQKVLSASMEGMTENVHAVVDDKKMVKVGTDDMLDFKAHFSDEDGTFFMRGRVAMRDAKMYQVLAMGKGETTSADGEAFVSSFRLK